jgi:hypothetical protein
LRIAGELRELGIEVSAMPVRTRGAAATSNATQRVNLPSPKPAAAQGGGFLSRFHQESDTFASTVFFNGKKARPPVNA